MCVYLFLSLPAKTNMPMLLSEPKGMEQFTIQPASCPLPCGFGKCQGEKKKKKDQSKDPATFCSDPLVLTFKETLKG